MITDEIRRKLLLRGYLVVNQEEQNKYYIEHFIKYDEEQKKKISEQIKLIKKEFDLPDSVYLVPIY